LLKLGVIASVAGWRVLRLRRPEGGWMTGRVHFGAKSDRRSIDRPLIAELNGTTKRLTLPASMGHWRMAYRCSALDAASCRTSDGVAMRGSSRPAGSGAPGPGCGDMSKGPAESAGLAIAELVAASC